jgi:ribosomal protein S18 acetylase RimI-like enzyme
MLPNRYCMRDSSAMQFEHEDSQVDFQRASDGDLAAIAELMNDAYSGRGPVPSWTNVARLIDGVRTTDATLRQKLADRPAAGLFVVRDRIGGPYGNPILASLWLEPRAEGIWYLDSLAVDPHRQNLGFGRRVLLSAERWAAARGGRIMKLDVLNVRQPLIAWYERRGYRLTGETRIFPYQAARLTPARNDFVFLALQKALVDGPHP